jgi:hypothetical protein
MSEKVVDREREPYLWLCSRAWTLFFGSDYSEIDELDRVQWEKTVNLILSEAPNIHSSQSLVGKLSRLREPAHLGKRGRKKVEV